MVLALLGVWTSVAVVYFDLVDYQGVLGEYRNVRDDVFMCQGDIAIFPRRCMERLALLAPHKEETHNCLHGQRLTHALGWMGNYAHL